MPLLAPVDALWLWAESSDSPFHIMGLQLFRPPDDAPANLIEQLYTELTDPTCLKPEFRRRPYRSLRTGGQYAWSEEDDVDLTEHVKRIGLPRPGGIGEFLRHVSDFHTTCLPRHRPLWEAHLVEGLDNGRFALCTKVHHSRFDGVSFGRHLIAGLADKPAKVPTTPAWLASGPTDRQEPRSNPPLSERARHNARVVKEVAQSARALTAMTTSAVTGRRPTTLPFSAPPTILNRKVSHSRRVTAQAWPSARIRAVAKAADVSTNEVALAMCGDALRSYLHDQNALPASSLVALVPVSLRSKTEDGNTPSGNAVSAVLCPLGTDLPDPAQRIEVIHNAMNRKKALLNNLDPLASTLVGVTNMGGSILQALPTTPRVPHPAFNLVISNVPLAKRPLYLKGCELTDFYPLSVVYKNQALNITLVADAEHIAFGITGCPQTVPNLERLPAHLDSALTALQLHNNLTTTQESPGPDSPVPRQPDRAACERERARGDRSPTEDCDDRPQQA